MTTALIAALCFASPAGLHVDTVAKQGVSYAVHHPLTDLTHKTGDVEGAARLLSDGTIQVELRAPVSSFHTGSSGTDETLDSLLDAALFPNVTVKALVPPQVRQPAGTTIEASAKIQIELHGIKRIFPATVTIAYGTGGQATIASRLAIRLPDFGILARTYTFLVAGRTIDFDIEAPTDMYRAAGKIVPVAFDLAWSSEQVADR